MKYHIGDLSFKSKKDCENYTRTLIHSLGCCEIKKEHPEYIFFKNLIQRHPNSDEKVGAGIDFFYIEPNPMMKKYYQTMIRRIDGTQIDFSWVQCCNERKRSTQELLTRAMRTAVKEDVIKFKQNQRPLICSVCKAMGELYEDYHVDHHNPSFQTLKDTFLIKRESPVSFEDCKKYNLTLFKDEDKKFKNDWIDFHNENCNFQILCRGCNFSKSNK